MLFFLMLLRTYCLYLLNISEEKLHQAPYNSTKPTLISPRRCSNYLYNVVGAVELNIVILFLHLCISFEFNYYLIIIGEYDHVIKISNFVFLKTL